MKVSVFINRALSGLDKRTRYESPGRMPSFEASVWPENSRNDCSGFVDWCLRFTQSRRVDHPLYVNTNGGWFETTAIHADGLASVGYFAKLDAVKPGAMLVYPDHRGEDGRMHEGHIGIVLEATGPKITDVTKIIHCSFGQWEEKGDAIQVTDSRIWQRNVQSIAVWFDGMEE